MNADSVFFLLIWVFVFWACWKLFLKKIVAGHSVTKHVSAHFQARQIPDEAYFEQAALEISQGHIRPGLMAKAWTQSGGDQRRADVLYVKLRVEAMREEAATAFRQAAVDREQPPNSNQSGNERSVLACPRCRQNVRVPAACYLEISCPTCKNVFVSQT